MKELLYDQIFTVGIYIYIYIYFKKRCITKLKFWSFEIVVYLLVRKNFLQKTEKEIGLQSFKVMNSLSKQQQH